METRFPVPKRMDADVKKKRKRKRRGPAARGDKGRLPARNSFHFPRMLASFFIHPREIRDHLKSTHGPFLPRPSWYIVRKEISVVDRAASPPPRLTRAHRPRPLPRLSHHPHLPGHPFPSRRAPTPTPLIEFSSPASCFLRRDRRETASRHPYKFQRAPQLIFIRTTPASFITSFLSRAVVAIRYRSGDVPAAFRLTSSLAEARCSSDLDRLPPIFFFRAPDTIATSGSASTGGTNRGNEQRARSFYVT